MADDVGVGYGCCDRTRPLGPGARGGGKRLSLKGWGNRTSRGHGNKELCSGSSTFTSMARNGREGYFLGLTAISSGRLETGPQCMRLDLTWGGRRYRETELFYLCTVFRGTLSVSSEAKQGGGRFRRPTYQKGKWSLSKGKDLGTP